MKSLALFGSLFFCSTLVFAADLSPKKTETKIISGKPVRIQYSAPSVRGREGKLFNAGGKISTDPNYPVWRAGANSATSFHTESDINIGGLDVPKGDYTLYVNLKDPDNWELIVNRQTGQWGLKYNKDKDLGRVKMTMAKPPKMVEVLKYTLSDAGDKKGTLQLEWEDYVASVPLTVK
jgi:hypothetical protein